MVKSNAYRTLARCTFVLLPCGDTYAQREDQPSCILGNLAEEATMRYTNSIKPKLKALSLLLGSVLLVGGPLAWGDTDDGSAPPYGPGMMWRYQAAPNGNTNGGYAYGPGMMQGYGRGYGYGPGMMQGYGYGPGMAWGQGYGGWGGYGPGMMGGGASYGYGPGAMQGYDIWRGAPLQLTDQQRQRLYAIHAKAAKERWPLLGQMQEQRFALARLLASDNPDKKAVDDAYNKLSQTGRQLLDLRIETRRATWSVLTAAQRKQLQQGGAPAQ